MHCERRTIFFIASHNISAGSWRVLSSKCRTNTLTQQQQKTIKKCVVPRKAATGTYSLVNWPKDFSTKDSSSLMQATHSGSYSSLTHLSHINSSQRLSSTQVKKRPAPAGAASGFLQPSRAAPWVVLCLRSRVM